MNDAPITGVTGEEAAKRKREPAEDDGPPDRSPADFVPPPVVAISHEEKRRLPIASVFRGACAPCPNSVTSPPLLPMHVLRFTWVRWDNLIQSDRHRTGV